MRRIIAFACIQLFALTACWAQDDRPTVAVPVAANELGRETFDRYLPPITQKVTQILKQTKRFVVVNRSEEEVRAEREFQANPEFLDRLIAAKKSGDMSSVQDIIDQNSQYRYLSFDTLASGEVVFRGADYILKIELRKLDINRMVNPDGSVNGYKTLLGLQLSVIDAETNEVIEAEGFTSTPLKVALTSPVRSVDASLLTMEGAMYAYLLQAFPVKCRIVKTEDHLFVINAGSMQGVAKGDLFEVSVVTKVAGAEIADRIGSIRVKGLAGAGNAVCAAQDGGSEITEAFKSGQPMICTLIKSKNK